MRITLRCPDCRREGSFEIDPGFPMAGIPELAKECFQCNCRHHRPNIHAGSRVLETLIAVDGTPAAALLQAARPKVT